MQYIDQVVMIHADRNNYIEFVIIKFLLIQFQIIISVLGNMSGSCFIIRDSDGKDMYGI